VTKAEYAAYQAAVQAFFEREEITHLSTGVFECPACEVEFDDNGLCPRCGMDREEGCPEPHFSWHPCDCCGSHLGGDRVHAAGWHRDDPPDTPIKKYSICVDCEYYNEYHRLDDMTLLEIERSAA